MSKPRMIPVHAVVRFDSEQVDPQSMFTVKEVLPTAEEALSEVDRLNEENRDRGATYFAQYTRFYSEGRSSSETAR